MMLPHRHPGQKPGVLLARVASLLEELQQVLTIAAFEQGLG